MKIVQVVSGYVHWVTPYKRLEELPEMELSHRKQFKEAPDNVHDNWFYNYATGEFTAPPLPQGWKYDENGVPFTFDEEILNNTQNKIKEYELKEIRCKRNILLKETDFIIQRHFEQKELVSLGLLKITTLSEEKFQGYLKYRQTLRDLPEVIDLNNITFPKLEEIIG